MGGDSSADGEGAPRPPGDVATIRDVLAGAARALVTELDAHACTISRSIGDLLVDLIDYSKEGKGVQVGHGYLISDYPLTREVLERLEPRTVCLQEPPFDEHEAQLLRTLGFDSLLMLALETNGQAWGLVEVYDSGRKAFTDAEIDAAQRIVAEAGVALTRLVGPA